MAWRSWQSMPLNMCATGVDLGTVRRRAGGSQASGSGLPGAGNGRRLALNRQQSGGCRWQSRFSTASGTSPVRFAVPIGVSQGDKHEHRPTAWRENRKRRCSEFTEECGNRWWKAISDKSATCLRNAQVKCSIRNERNSAFGRPVFAAMLD